MKITIFEGPDGAGKTTLARDYAAATGGRYLAFGPFLHVHRDLARLYAEAIIPACQKPAIDLVLDRCWISEAPYGSVMRNGDRLGVRRRILERLAMRASTIVVMMLPEWRVVQERYRDRHDREYVDHVDKLERIYLHYAHTKLTDLPKITLYDDTPVNDILWLDDTSRLDQACHRHPYVGSAGNLDAPVLLVGDKFTKHRDGDMLYQWPFGSFSGSSTWLTGQLELGNVSERDLVWINADQPDDDIQSIALGRRCVIALGHTANNRLTGLGIGHVTFDNPQWWKRFRYFEPYALVPFVKEVLGQ